MRRPIVAGHAAEGRPAGGGRTSAFEVHQLRALVALVDHGSVSRAATALGLAQSTVSEALASLDRAAGTPTVVRKRGRHGVRLTPAGEALLPHARRVLAQLEEAHLALAGVTHHAQSRVAVIANESISTYLLPQALGALRRVWPNTSFAVSVGTCDAVRAGLAAGQADLGLLLEGEDSPVAPREDSTPSAGRAGGRLELAAGLPLVVFAGPEHALARPQSIPLRRSALGAYDMFVSDAAGDLHQLLRRYFAEDGLPGPRLEASGTIEGVKRGVTADPAALGLLPRYAVAEELSRGRWIALSLDPPPPRLRLIALLGHSPPHPAIADLLDSMRSVPAPMA